MSDPISLTIMTMAFICFSLLALIGLVKLCLTVHRKQLGHLCSAIAWTILTVVFTIQLLVRESVSLDVAGFVTQLLAGTGMMQSWIDLSERRKALGPPPTGIRAMPRALLLCTLAGPIALLLLGAMLRSASNAQMDRAVANHDMGRIVLLHRYGLSLDNAWDKLHMAESAHDIVQEGACLEAMDRHDAVDVVDNFEEGIGIIDLALRYTDDPDDLLRTVAWHGNTEQTEYLMRRGIQLKLFAASDMIPIQEAIDNTRTSDAYAKNAALANALSSYALAKSTRLAHGAVVDRANVGK